MPNVMSAIRHLVPRAFRPVWRIVVLAAVVGSLSASTRAEEYSLPDESLDFGHVQIDWTSDVPAPLKAVVDRRVQAVLHGRVDERRFVEGTQALLTLLADEGYRRAAIAPRDFAVDDGALNFSLLIVPGPRLLVGGWRFSGITHTDTTWLADALDLPVGVAWTRTLSERISQRLHTFAHLSAAGAPRTEPGANDSTVIVVIPLREQNPATIDGMLAASSVDGASASRQLTGRLSVGLTGLFRRDRSVRLRYEKPQPSERLFRLNLREAGAFGRRLDWQLGIEEWNRRDHRQTVDLAVGYGLGARDLRIEWRGRLIRVTPGQSATTPARTGELSLGLSAGPPLDVARRLLRSLAAWELAVTYSHRQQYTDDAVSPGGSSQRGRLDGRLLRSWWSGSGWYAGVVAQAHWWFARQILAAGDEWFLGGEEVLRGYEDRTLTAASGLIGSLELGRVWPRGFGLALFGEQSWLESFNDAATITTPAGYGLAILLFARDRTGRLEVAWRDHVAWRDGIVRLSVTQGW